MRVRMPRFEARMQCEARAKSVGQRQKKKNTVGKPAPYARIRTRQPLSEAQMTDQVRH